MGTRLLLIRHGETTWNMSGKFQGCKDIDLNENGILQANALKKRIGNDFDVVFSSPLKRAYETAKIIAEGSNKDVKLLDEIREINFGKWEGLNIKEISENFPDDYKLWRTDCDLAPLVGGDLSIKNASLRAYKCVMEVVKENKDKKIIIVAHGGIIKAALISLFGWNMNMYHKIALGNTCINEIRFTEDFSPYITTINDTAHLDKDAKSV